ncbi:MAG TPA: ABC-F family ATP-binding cassette domain-containing protein [Thermoanaerobaculia bacterium]|jgi:ATP-binding cassette subfamily F protein 3
MLYRFENIEKSYGPHDVLRGVTWQHNPGEHVGLVGRNGAGKTTLFRLLLKQEDPDRGEMYRSSGLTIGHVGQHLDAEAGMSLFDYVETAFADVLTIERKMRGIEHDLADSSRPDHERLLEKYAELQHDYEHADGYTLHAEVERVLMGVGFDKGEFERPIAEFSGGQQNRAMLARVLLTRVDLLLLDEPTNHLDLKGIEFIEEFLQSFNGSYLVISHDRTFLNRTVGKIIELAHGKLIEYSGNYEKFLQLRAERMEKQAKDYERQQEYIADTQEFIRRNLAGQKTKQAKSRRKMLGKLDEIERPETDETLANFKLDAGPRSGAIALTVDRLNVGYAGARPSPSVSRHPLPEGEGDVEQVHGPLPGGEGDVEQVHDPLPAGECGPKDRVRDVPPRDPWLHPVKAVVHNFSITIRRGERYAIMGPNGSGKSTLLKTFASRLQPLGGTLAYGHNVHVGYYDQTLGDLNPNGRVIDEVWNLDTTQTEEQVRSYLAQFSFFDDDAFKKTRDLSGGEKGRLALAKIMYTGGNLMLLDEPTNHLDVYTREALEEALERFTGALIVVSHDRYFIDRVAENIILVEDGHAAVYSGNYTDLVERFKAGTAIPEKVQVVHVQPVLPSIAKQEPKVHADRGEQRKREKRVRKIDEEMSGLEERISAAERERERNDTLLCSEEVFRDGERVRKIQQQNHDLKSMIDLLYGKWESLAKEKDM